MPERERTEERRLIEQLRRSARFLAAGASRSDHDLSTLTARSADALDRLITEADTAERERDEKQRVLENVGAASKSWQIRALDAERERDEARKALAQIRRRSEPGSLIHELARDALASLTDTDSEGDPVLDALARGDESMAARLTTEREQMLRGRVVLTAEEAEQIARTIRRLQTHPTPGLRRAADAALALLLGRQHPKARLDAANKQ